MPGRPLLTPTRAKIGDSLENDSATKTDQTTQYTDEMTPRIRVRTQHESVFLLPPRARRLQHIADLAREGHLSLKSPISGEQAQELCPTCTPFLAPTTYVMTPCKYSTPRTSTLALCWLGVLHTQYMHSVLVIIARHAKPRPAEPSVSKTVAVGSVPNN